MYVKAIKLESAKDESLRILNAILGDRRDYFEVSPSKVAAELGISEGNVRYHLKKLVKFGYLRVVGDGYKPTDKVLFLKFGA